MQQIELDPREPQLKASVDRRTPSFRSHHGQPPEDKAVGAASTKTPVYTALTDGLPPRQGRRLTAPHHAVCHEALYRSGQQ